MSLSRDGDTVRPLLASVQTEEKLPQKWRHCLKKLYIHPYDAFTECHRSLAAFVGRCVRVLALLHTLRFLIPSLIVAFCSAVNTPSVCQLFVKARGGDRGGEDGNCVSSSAASFLFLLRTPSIVCTHTHREEAPV